MKWLLRQCATLVALTGEAWVLREVFPPISANPVHHQRTKHIAKYYHYCRDLVLAGEIELVGVGTKYQVADIFTKPFSDAKAEAFEKDLALINIFSGSKPRINYAPVEVKSFRGTLTVPTGTDSDDAEVAVVATKGPPARSCVLMPYAPAMALPVVDISALPPSFDLRERAGDCCKPTGNRRDDDESTAADDIDLQHADDSDDDDWTNDFDLPTYTPREEHADGTTYDQQGKSGYWTEYLRQAGTRRPHCRDSHHSASFGGYRPIVRDASHRGLLGVFP